MVEAGYDLRPVDPAVTAWAQAAYRIAQNIDTSERRHGDTWFVGVDALCNDADGSILDVPMPFADMAPHWHSAQISIVYPGYPKQDRDETDAAHRFRHDRDAAHMDGLLPEGPQRRRHLREPHGFIIGMALNDVAASPLVVWPGSHAIMKNAFRAAFEGLSPEAIGDMDVTDVYQTARRTVFQTCPRIEVPTRVGEAVILDRHLIHGVAPWSGPAHPEGRMIAYFRPIASYADWL